ncbi:MAG: histidine phosphatase family protein [Candidatus Sungbacteria bacterium]|nr:histidine phosphatase family protein [Candidatus Sungbacteria bacterium]
MKWPASVTLVRHGQSTYNALRRAKARDPRYQEFRREFETNPDCIEVRGLAHEVRRKYALGISDYKTPLTDAGKNQALSTGLSLDGQMRVPDIIFCSPYLRTLSTLGWMRVMGTNLRGVRDVVDDRIREQEHGLALLYNDWRIFQALHPEQKELRDLQGAYWYQYPQGESVSQVRDRVRDFLGMLIRECAGMHVMLVTHHLTILSFRANLERLAPEQFMRLDKHEKPVNCGVTRYECDPRLGKDGKLVLQFYNQRLF